MKKSGVIWVTVPPSGRPVAAWHLWRDDAAYLVTGPAEQPVSGLAEASGCTGTVPSKDKGGRIVTWRADVTRVAPGTDEWAEVVPALLTARLNLPDAEEAEKRWATTCAVLRLRPTGELAEAGTTLPDGSLAAAPPPSPATTPARIPYTLGRRRRAGRGSHS